MRRTQQIAGIVAALLMVAEPALAQELSEEVQAQAAALFDQALASFEAGDYENARVLFERASEISPHPTVLFNLAQAQRRSGRLLDAERTLVALLRRHDIDRDLSERCRQELNATHDEIPTLHIQIQGLRTNDQVRVGEAVIPHASLDAVRVEPGQHPLLIRRAGASIYAGHVSAVRGTVSRVVIALSDAGSSTRDANAAQPRTAPAIATGTGEPTDTETDAASEPRAELALTVHGRGTVGRSPTLAGGFGAAATFSHPAFIPVRLEVNGSLPGTVSLGPVSAELWALDVGLSACPRIGDETWRLDFCGGVSAGFVHAQGRGFPVNDEGFGVAVDMLAAIRPSVRIDQFLIALGAGLGVAITRPSFVYAQPAPRNSGTLFTPVPLWGVGDVSVGWAFE